MIASVVKRPASRPHRLDPLGRHELRQAASVVEVRMPELAMTCKGTPAVTSFRSRVFSIALFEGSVLGAFTVANT